MSFFRTIYTLWIRQVKRSLRSRARLFGSLGQPLLFLVALGFGFGPIYAKAGGGNYIQFIAPGVIAMGILFNGVFSGIELIWDRQFGFLKETLVAPVSRFAIMFGRTLGGATMATVQGIVVLLLTLLVGFRPVSLLLLPVSVLFMFIIALLFSALGHCIASKLNDMQAFPIIMNFLVMPIFFLSGSLFPLQGLPRGIVIAATLNPLSYGVDGLRATLVNGSHFGLGVDFAVLGIVTFVLLGIGGYLFNRIQI